MRNKLSLFILLLVLVFVVLATYTIKNLSFRSRASTINSLDPRPRQLWGGCFKLSDTPKKCYGSNGAYLGFKRKPVGANSYPVDIDKINEIANGPSGAAFSSTLPYMRDGYIHPNLVILIRDFIQSHTITNGDGHQAEILNLQRCCVSGTENRGADCTLRDHYTGSAVDIYGINGVEVKTPDNQTIKDAIQWFINNKSAYLIEDIGMPTSYGAYFDKGVDGDGIFSNPAHYNHIHISFNFDNVCQ